ncbi:hypothetical protein I7I53_04588 [Histoplasma capsulatum var. duboisii H88]|uniref:Uncharacterized protein n=1 Tax=Ajellomyces capsulatus (strain H88) TaxID=544711 RepID=A0A8A1LRH5_AJEC8|nr:hypothetical protein I7I53_04588 [Histoplasma capsulatum var. duboisii H88]
MTAERLSSVGFRPYDVRQIWDIFYGTSPLPQANDGVQQHRLANTMILRHAVVNNDFSVLLVTYLVGGKGLKCFCIRGRCNYLEDWSAIASILQLYLRVQRPPSMCFRLQRSDKCASRADIMVNIANYHNLYCNVLIRTRGANFFDSYFLFWSLWRWEESAPKYQVTLDAQLPTPYNLIHYGMIAEAEDSI